MAEHAFLSASSSHRWLACPPSAKLCAAHPSRGSPFSQQGTDAHTLAAWKVEKALGRDVRDPTPDLDYYDSEMAACADEYARFVIEQLEEARKHCGDPLVLVEQKLDFSRWVPEGFGTGDACIVADDTIHVIDLKYGTGILVDAQWNSQMMCYALGLLEAYDGIYEIRIELGSNIYRVFCCFDEGAVVVLFHGIQKKSQKTPLKEIRRAEAIKKEYLKSKEK